MIAAGVREVKNRLSRYLALVKQGEEIVVTERGRPVARIIREGQESSAIHNALRPLIEKGLVRLPSRPLESRPRKPLRLSGKPASEMLLEDRR